MVAGGFADSELGLRHEHSEKTAAPGERGPGRSGRVALTMEYARCGTFRAYAQHGAITGQLNQPGGRSPIGRDPRLGHGRQAVLDLARLFPGVLLAPTANHVISAGEQEIAKTHARDRAGNRSVSAARQTTTLLGIPGNSGRCGQRDEERGREESP